MLPYAATLLALALLPRRNAGGLGGAVGPLQLGRPWPE
jgi:hypothetical protein